MPNQDPDHLLDRAEAAIRPGATGRVRQTDLRRTISDAYYAAFHAILTAATDTVVGRRHRGTGPYSLAYRSIDHRTIRELCQTARLPFPSQRYRPHIPGGSFGPIIRDLADNFLALQRQRNTADYDPAFTVTPSEANAAILLARHTLASWKEAPSAERRTFLHLLLFPPR